MKKTNTFLFTLFLTFSVLFLVLINFFNGTAYFRKLDISAVSLISLVMVIFIVIVFLLREKENNKVRNEFVTIITHKFRTPLTGIRWTIDMLQKDISLLEKKDLLLEMQKANDRLMEIVDLLVGFAKFDRKLDYAYEAVSLREIVNMSLSKYSAAGKLKNIHFLINSDRELPLIIIDRAKIQFVVDMLVDNAIKYTPKDGSVTISFEMDSKCITLKITDTGIGFNYFESLRLFNHFFRSPSAKLMETEGLGLGLYTARLITKHHKGKLWAESRGANKGSTFFLCLPIKR